MKPLGIVALVLIAPFLLATPGASQEKKAENWEFAPAPNGMVLEELFHLVTSKTGQSILYNPQDPTIKNKRIFFTGKKSIPTDRILNWLQAVMSYHKLVLVPIGPEDNRHWAVLNLNDPSVGSHPIYVPEADLEKWADRDGVYIVTTLTLRHVQDTTRARNAFANLITRPAGRINDVPGTRSMVIGDFAPVVFSMAMLAREMDREAAANPVPPTPTRTSRQPARPSVPPPPIDPKRQAIDRYEQMLRDAKTEEAAKYFVGRLEVLLEEGEDADE